MQNDEFDLTVYVPTRGRPENALRLQDQFYKTVSLNTRVVFILSDNDDKLKQYRDLHYWTIVSPEKAGFVDPLNLGYFQDRRSMYSYAVGFMGDDHFPRTARWDEQIIHELKNMKSGLVYANDKFQEHRIPTQIFMTADIPLALGFMTLPRLMHLYADNFWLDLGKGLDRITYLPNVIIEHLHPAAGKAENDQGYEFSGNFALDQSDGKLYRDYVDNELATDIQSVKNAIRRNFNEI